MNTFAELNLIEPLCRALEAESYTQPTPIQAQAIPPVLAGHDLLASAQTGTGKTAAFALPLLQRLANGPPARGRRAPRALILAPTRELVAQIEESLRTYGRFLRLKLVVIYGGVGERPQIQRLGQGVDVIVATPGRLLDLLNRGFVDLSQIECFVLDEADRMLDMGFIHDIRRISTTIPLNRQTLLFSATMPRGIQELSTTLLRDPVRVSITPQQPTVERIEQQLMFVSQGDKADLLISLLDQSTVERAIVFTRTKHGADRLTKRLATRGFKATAIHGNKSQNARSRALDGFRDGAFNVLVATDVASRGIDVDEVSHVFNYDLPNEPDSYVHRIGRTARAGREGAAVSFCSADEWEFLRDIERTIGASIPVTLEQPFHNPAAVPTPRNNSRGGGGGGGRRPNGGGGGGNRRFRGGGRR